MVDFSDLLGKPFAYGGRGPECFDCYGLVRELYHRAHGLWLPDYTSPMSAPTIAALLGNQLQLYRQVPVASVNRIVVFRVLGYASHVGFTLGYDRFVHCWEGSNAVVMERLSFDWGSRIVGCYEYVTH